MIKSRLCPFSVYEYPCQDCEDCAIEKEEQAKASVASLCPVCGANRANYYEMLHEECFHGHGGKNGR